MPRKTTLAQLAVAGLALLSACSSGDNGGTGPGTQAQLTLNLAIGANSGASLSRAALGARATAFDVTSPTPGTFTDGTNTIVLTKVDLVLRDIELKRQNDEQACAAAPSTSMSGTDDGSGHDANDDNGHDANDDNDDNDACEKLQLGPVLFEVPLTGSGVEHVVTVTVSTGTFNRLEFTIHKPEDDGTAADAAFLAAHPDFKGVSIRVEGTFNGNPFTFESDLNADQRVTLNPPLVITENVATELTLRLDLAAWFQSGGTLIDPATAGKGGQNENVVKDNIKDSFEAFEDNNRDGDED